MFFFLPPFSPPLAAGGGSRFRFHISERRVPSLRRDGAGGRRWHGRRRRGGGGGGRGGRGRRVAVAVGAAAVEAALERPSVCGRGADALGRVTVAVGGGGGRPAPPHVLRRRRGRAGGRGAVVVVVAVEPAFLRSGVHVVGRHELSCLFPAPA